MTSVVLLLCGLLSASPEPAAKAEDLAAYDAAKVKVGRDAEAHVKLALWCESHGLKAERVKHLALAVLADSKNALARGLMGLVAYQGKWDRPDQVAEKVKGDGTLADYRARRAKAPQTAEGQWKLALWCEQNGLDAEARAHLTEVVRLDPARELAWKRLGCKKVGGRWIEEADLVAEKVEAEAQKKADRVWKPLLTKWRGWLDARDSTKREEAENALAGVTDPRAAPMVWSVLVAGGKATHGRAVAVFGQIDGTGASRALAFLTVLDESPEVRRAAAETLKRRDLREYADLLIEFVRDPIKYQVEHVGGPGSPGRLLVSGSKANLLRIYAPPAVPTVPNLPGLRVEKDEYGLPVVRGVGHFQTFDDYLSGLNRLTGPSVVIVQGALGRGQPGHGPIIQGSADYVFNVPIGEMMNQAHRTAIVAEQQLENDAARIDDENEKVRLANDRVLPLLKEVSGRDLGPDATAWKKWWVDQLGYALLPQKTSAETPTIVENVPIAYQPANPPTTTIVAISAQFRRTSCFGAGTLVRTLDGARPIEQIKVGDRVLTQDVKTGALGYQPVTVIHHNPPSPTFLVKVKEDTIVSSPFHRFWVAGKGWIMARDLKGTETLRLLDGPARVESVAAGPVQPVFNLDVADAHDFFAGGAAALVHDNTLPDTRLSPFDAPPALASK